MNCKVQVTDAAWQKIKSIETDGDRQVELLRAIHRDLGALERLNGFRSVAPVRFHTHRIIFHCPKTGERHKWLLWVDDGYTCGEGMRVVIDSAHNGRPSVRWNRRQSLGR